MLLATRLRRSMNFFASIPQHRHQDQRENRQHCHARCHECERSHKPGGGGNREVLGFEAVSRIGLCALRKEEGSTSNAQVRLSCRAIATTRHQAVPVRVALDHAHVTLLRSEGPATFELELLVGGALVDLEDRSA